MTQDLLVSKEKYYFKKVNGEDIVKMTEKSG